MLTPEQNEVMTQVGSGTACGELLRRYWQPVAFAGELTEARPRKRVKLLGEDLVLYRIEQGTGNRGQGTEAGQPRPSVPDPEPPSPVQYGLVAEQCSHRGASLYYGFLEDGGIRCPYHGWLYDRTGRCLEQPFEPAQSMMKQTLRHPAYPVEELAGLLWTYMGPPDRKPLLPRWDVLVREDGERHWEVRPLECNWLQAMENTPDFVHTYYLHGHNLKLRGLPGADYYYRPFEKYGFRTFEWGIVKLWTYAGETSESGWGHPLIFPNMQRALEGRGDAMHWRVPQDDTHTLIFVCTFIPTTDGRPTTETTEPRVRYFAPMRGADGEYELTSFSSQDHMAWESEGPIYNRATEQLGASDLGIVLFREMLRDQIEAVRAGEEPMGLVRDPAGNDIVHLIVREDGLPPDADDITWVIPSGQLSAINGGALP